MSRAGIGPEQGGPLPPAWRAHSDAERHGWRKQDGVEVAVIYGKTASEAWITAG
jgi:hypothetical protein